jgi:hypothetical protein
VLLFVVYAVIVWYFAMVYRRRWPGFLAVALGLVGMLVINHLHTRFSDFMRNSISKPVMQVLLYAETALVPAVGLYIALLPRGRMSGRCPHCGRDLTDVDTAASACPGCAAKFPVEMNDGCCGRCRYNLAGMEEAEGVCPECGTPFYPHRQPPPWIWSGVERGAKGRGAHPFSSLGDDVSSGGPVPMKDASAAPPPPEGSGQEHQQR